MSAQLSDRLALVFVSCALVGLACDDKPASEPERKSVIEGGKAESEPGKKLERAKQDIEDVENELERRDAERFEKTAGEQVERGVP